MIGALIFLVMFQAALFLAFARWILADRNRVAGEEATRLVLMANYALDSLKSKSIEEKVRAEALRKEYDVRLEMYRDAVAKEVTTAKTKKKVEDQAPQWVTTDTGQQVNLHDLEMME